MEPPAPSAPLIESGKLRHDVLGRGEQRCAAVGPGLVGNGRARYGEVVCGAVGTGVVESAVAWHG